MIDIDDVNASPSKFSADFESELNGKIQERIEKRDFTTKQDPTEQEQEEV